MAGWGIGELTAMIAVVVMLSGSLSEGETRDLPRFVLGTLHALAVIIGVDLVFMMTEVSPPWLEGFFGLSNMFALVLLGVVVSMLFPIRAPGESLLPMVEVTLGPFTGAAVWGMITMPEELQWSDPGSWWLPLVMLGFHYTILGVLLLSGLLLLRVADRPRQLWTEPAAVLFEVIILSWIMQIGWMVTTQTEMLLGHGTEGVILGVLMSLLGVWRIVSRSLDNIRALGDSVRQQAGR